MRVRAPAGIEGGQFRRPAAALARPIHRTVLPTAQRSLRRAASAVPLLIAGALTALLVWPAFAHAVQIWMWDPEFTFGFLVPPVVAILLWRCRGALREQASVGAWGGLAVVFGALALYLLGQRAGLNAVAGLAVSPLLWGIAVTLWGWGVGRILAFPVAFLSFGLALYRGLLDSVGFALQQVTAVGAAAGANALGIDVVRDGLVLEADNFAFIIAEACSGMSSLVALLALTALWTYLVPTGWRARLVLLTSVLPIVAVANTLRVLLVLGVAAHFGQEAAVGFFHGASSLALFGFAIGALALVNRMVGCRFDKHAAGY